MGSRTGRVALLVSLAILFQGANGQEGPPIHLKLDQTTAVPGLPVGPSLPVRCDSKGNIYAQFDQVSAFRDPVFRISTTGELKANYSLHSVPGWEDGEFYDFAVRPDGSVNLLAKRKTRNRDFEYGIVELSEDGQFRSVISVRLPNFVIEQLAVFSTGEFLVSGSKKEEPKKGPQASGPGTGEENANVGTYVVDKNGNVIREVDLTIQEGAEEQRPHEGMRLPRSAIGYARNASDEQGNVFLMFFAEKATLYVLTPKSPQVRKLEVAPPENEAWAMDLKYAAGTGLVIQFAKRSGPRRWRTGNAVYSIVDPQTGARNADYQSAPDVAGAFACYSPRGFLFLSQNEQGQLVIRRATPQ